MLLKKGNSSVRDDRDCIQIQAIVNRRLVRFTYSLAALVAIFLSAITPSVDTHAEEISEEAAKAVTYPHSVDREALSRLIEQQKIQAAQRPAIEELARSKGLPIRREFADGSFILLRGFEEGRPIYDASENLIAADSVSTDEVWAGGSLGLDLDGSGEVLAIWDGGSPLLTHQELVGRVTHLDGAGTSNHSSHVGCTMMASGVIASARGMASAASLISHDAMGDTLEMAQEQMEAEPVKVSNHSYGLRAGWTNNLLGDGLAVWLGDVQVSTQEDVQFGFYHQLAADRDQLAYDSPYYLIVQSAGNDRNDDAPPPGTNHWHFDGSVGDFVMATDDHPDDYADNGYDTINGGAKAAKNILTIGAVEDIVGGWTQPSDVQMTAFSNWGPTDDGRIKPDLVANGSSLESCWGTAPWAYASISGSSMATPVVSGSLGLLHQHALNLFGEYFRAATMKALVLHTADEAGQLGPDYSFGWGLLNIAAAADVLTAQAEAALHVQEQVLDDRASYVTVVSSEGDSPLVVTMVWTDPPGTPPDNSVVDPPDRMLVNDLDLRVIGPGGTVHEPWILDPANPAAAATLGDNQVDSVEQIWISAPAAGSYTIQVSHEGTLVEPGAAPGAERQSFSLVITGNADPSIFADGFELGNLSAWWTVVGGS